ncbi:hypothetical protein LG047_12680 [Methylocystis sp. WRRC1]|uniref:hypothetical protein n=1 Tax=unclassified Methylocystis TaxID=2625913 RepID=UPI0001F86851|nr:MULTISPECIES: hypothetical protein [unclassified Methylocystis]MCC3246165.1 hypothetical protein [Methylocystis sp. WRRC1]
MTLHVTDHAVLRYIERIHGVDIERLREDMRQRLLRAADAAEGIGGGSYVINAEGVRYRVVGFNVVTVLSPRES